MKHRLMAILLLCPSLLYSAEAAKHVPTVDELMSLQTISGSVISPEGQSVVYSVRSVDFEKDAYITQLWLARTDGTPPYQLTRGEKSASQPRWSPDGAYLTFTRNYEGQSQLFAIRPNGGEAVRISQVESGVGGYQWDSTGKKIAFTATTPLSKENKSRKEHLGDFVVFRKDYDFSQLWTLDVEKALEEPQKGDQLTEGTELNVLGFSWSPDSTTIAFSASTDPDLINRHTTDIYLLDLEDRSVTATVTMDGPDSDPHYSPDGLSIVFSTYQGETKYYTRNSHLGLIPAESAKPLSLTENFDEHPRFVDWTAEGIYFSALQKTSSHLFRVDPDSRKIVRISGPDSLMAGSFSMSRDGRTVAFVASSPTSMTEVYTASVDDFEPRRLTDMSRQVASYVLGSREVISWESKDGTEIEGVLVKPADFDPAKKYALLCVIHGGPTGIDRPVLVERGTRYYPVDIWAAKGALILRVNYRGSAGYGEAFRGLNMRNLGVGDAWDVISGVQYLIDKGWVDSERVGSMGWSQGGYISAFLTTSSDRFAAISVGAGISNWATYYYNTDITPFTINYLGDDPVDDPEIYQITSPMSYIKKAQTPTLIQHGEFDRRVPPANAYELRQGLEDRGVPVELIIYKGFGHGISTPKAMRAVMQHNLGWFNHYLWGEELPDFTKPEVPAKEKDSEK